MRIVGDRFGLGWRPELAADILGHLDQIDVVEVIADDLVRAPRALQAIETLSAQLPIALHGVGLGMASAHPVDGARLDAMARLVDRLEPDCWSEHLAFVRAGGIEIGHLAAPPRTPMTVEGALANLARAATAAGTRPLVENVATLIDPPASSMSEGAWVGAIVRASACGLLLDLHNLYANACNQGVDPLAALIELPLDRVAWVHLAGGRRIPSLVPGLPARILDDHLHDVPPQVFGLLEELGALAPQSITVIIERDGAYPAFDRLAAELDRARRSLAAGRARAQGARV